MLELLEQYLKLLDTFKAYQISKILQATRQKILATIQGEYFSDRIKNSFRTINREGEPFIGFAHEPKQITQIKNIINALYHAELAFTDLETVNLRDGKQKHKDLFQMYHHTIRHSYQASYLLTHLDIDISEIFSAELKQLIQLLAHFKDFTHAYVNNATVLTKKLMQYPIGYKTGLISGIAIDQMKPHSGTDIDYNFLTQFSAVLPGYIQQFTSHIQRYSSQITIKPTLDKEKLNALQKKGFKLLSALEKLRADDFFLFAKFIYYADITRHIIFLSRSTFEQVGKLNDSSQEAIRDNLARLKYHWLVALFGLVDRVEDEGLLAPCRLSEPLMTKIIKPLYELLVKHASTIVDFSKKGQELLTLEDTKFVALRLEESQQRINKAKRNLIKIKQAEKAFTVFLEILKGKQCLNRVIINLPNEIKTTLPTHYTLLQPYIKQLDLDLNNNVILALTKKGQWTFRTLNLQRWLPQSYETISVKDLLSLKIKLQALLARDKATQQLHIDLNEDLIQSVHAQADLSIYPYDRKTNVFSYDEAAVLKIEDDPENKFGFVLGGKNRSITKTDALTSEQALDLYQFYEDKKNQLARAQNAFDAFLRIMQTLEFNASKLEPESYQGEILVNLDSSLKAKLRNLYALFQPYMIDALAPDLIITTVDASIIASLSAKQTKADSPQSSLITTSYFLNTCQTIIACFSNTRALWHSQSKRYHAIAKQKYQEAAQRQTLTVDDTARIRAHYLIKHTHFSQALAELRFSLLQLISLFNEATKEQLKYADTSDLPFPELDDQNKTLEQSKQVLGIKRIFNFLYYLEQIGKQLESLNDKSTEIRYSYHLIQVFSHIKEIINLSKELHADPYLSLLATDIVARANSIYRVLLQHADPYITEHNAIVIPKAEEMSEYSSIRYALKAFMLIPAQLSALSKQTDLSEQELTEIQANTKRIAIKIEKIIANSSSYFKLFLKTPVMYGLFYELKVKLNQFTTITHDTVLTHIETINTDLLTRILLETDEWEDRPGFNPGELTEFMQTLLDEFYKGLVEPLGFISQRHIALISSLVPIEKRLAAVKKREEQAQAEIKQFPGYRVLYQLMWCIQCYDDSLIKSGFRPPEPGINTSHAKTQLIKAYKNALPILEENQHIIALLSGEIETSPQIDNLLNTEVLAKIAQQANTTIPQPLNEDNGEETIDRTALQKTNIVAQCRIVFSYYEGLVNTLKLNEDTAKEKIVYLDNLKVKQECLNKQFIIAYIKKAFDKRRELLLDRHIGLLHTGEEYNKKLEIYLLSWYPRILETALGSRDIDKTVGLLMAERIKLFDQAHFPEYSQLESIMVALTQFTMYFTEATQKIENHRSVFESEETLSNKQLLITPLKKIACDTNLTIEERILKMREKVNEFNFEQTMLAYQHPEPLTFAWLSQLVASFLKLLHLYTPKYVKRYEQLNKALNTPPNTYQANRRFSLFSKLPRVYDLPQPVILNTSPPSNS